MTFVAEPLYLLIFCIFGTYLWRALGAAVAQRIDVSGDLFQWFGCVSYAMLAGLITRVILIPAGTLAETPDIDRIAAMGFGLVVFFALKRNIFMGTITAFTVFLALTWARDIGYL